MDLKIILVYLLLTEKQSMHYGKMLIMEDFKGLTRNGNSITKTYNGNSEILFNNILTPPSK